MGEKTITVSFRFTKLVEQFVVTVNMGSAQPILEVAITFMQQKGPGVLLPLIWKYWVLKTGVILFR
jgi:hypothetical protein